MYAGRGCSCCITNYDFKFPTDIYSQFGNKPFELHVVAIGGAEYLTGNDSGKMAKAGTLNILGYSDFLNRVKFNAGHAMTIDFHFDENLFNKLLKSNLKFKQHFGAHKYGDNFAQFENNINGDIPFLVQLVKSVEDLGRLADLRKLDDIGISLLLKALNFSKSGPIDFIDWNCFSFAVNLPATFKNAKFQFSEVKQLAEHKNFSWRKIVTCTHMVYSCSPRTLMGNLKFKEFVILYKRNYSRRELEQHFGGQRSGHIVEFVMRHLKIDKKTFNKTYPFK